MDEKVLESQTAFLGLYSVPFTYISKHGWVADWTALNPTGDMNSNLHKCKALAGTGYSLSAVCDVWQGRIQNAAKVERFFFYFAMISAHVLRVCKDLLQENRCFQAMQLGCVYFSRLMAS